MISGTRVLTIVFCSATASPDAANEAIAIVLISDASGFVSLSQIIKVLVPTLNVFDGILN